MHNDAIAYILLEQLCNVLVLRHESGGIEKLELVLFGDSDALLDAIGNAPAILFPSRFEIAHANVFAIGRYAQNERQLPIAFAFFCRARPIWQNAIVLLDPTIDILDASDIGFRLRVLVHVFEQIQIDIRRIPHVTRAHGKRERKKNFFSHKTIS